MCLNNAETDGRHFYIALLLEVCDLGFLVLDGKQWVCLQSQADLLLICFRGFGRETDCELLWWCGVRTDLLYLNGEEHHDF